MIKWLFGLLAALILATAADAQTFDVSHYPGYDATGKSDSTGALQSAAADANAYANDGGKHDRAATIYFPCGIISVGGDPKHPGAALRIKESNITIEAQRAGCVIVSANRNWLPDSADPVEGGGRGNFVSVDGGHSAWNISHTVIMNFSFVLPLQGPSWHILSFIRTSVVVIVYNSAQQGNFETMNGVAHAWVANNHVENAGRACFGQWGGLSDVHIVDNYCTTTAAVSTVDGHAVGLAYTAQNSDGSAASAVGLYAHGNEFHVNDNDAGGCVNLNGDQTNGDSSNNFIQNNKCFVNNVDSFCILIMASGHDNNVTGNTCDKGTKPVPTKGAIVIGPNNIRAKVQNNTITNWVADKYGVINVPSIGAIIAGNKSTNVSAPFMGRVDATAKVMP